MGGKRKFVKVVYKRKLTGKVREKKRERGVWAAKSCYIGER
jgi:hypothetical protein